MSHHHHRAFDPKLDLVLERTTDVSPFFVWRAWTEPALLIQWFTPAPWRTVACEMDLRPGGIFSSEMRGPDGERNNVAGCWLEVVPQSRLVWTTALLPGFRPAPTPTMFAMTAVISIEPAQNGGTRYSATAMHTGEAERKQHDEMGFHAGWGAAFDQLVALAGRP